MPKEHQDDFVTKIECRQITSGFQDDLATVKKAIMGDDMRGGMVRDISEIKGRVNKVNNGGNGSLGKRERAMIYVTLIGTGGLVGVELIRVLIH
ncbi:hypothetical protein MUP77_13485 [Candidatus Bathyarchaeota archaeon]|nr:hypothetical protein [Candidatus Bathyarchaeota archaeon]